MKSYISSILTLVKEQKISKENAYNLLKNIENELQQGREEAEREYVSSGEGTGAGRTGSDIAVIGMDCRFPESDSIGRFWDNLIKGKDVISEFPEERAPLSDFYSAGGAEPDKSYSKWGGFIKDIDLFATTYFNISPEEASLLDPQQRLFLETAMHTFQSAGYSQNTLWGTNTAVFVGARMGTYNNKSSEESDTKRTSVTSNLTNFIASRVSDFYNLTGPSLAIDTACSSTLVALHYACKSLKMGECTMALVGGVNLHVTPYSFVNLSRAKALSYTGKSYVFDKRADGFVAGEGVGAVLLKPLDKALKDNDTIYSVIKGSSVLNDGHTMGITTPNLEGQKKTLKQAYSSANIDPSTVTYIEAHGTGTTIGDPIEIKALTEVFREYTGQKAFCAVGSVKTNIGHLDTASGIAGLIKVVLSLYYKKIPPTLNCDLPNARLNLINSPFYPNIKTLDWEARDGSPRRAGLSSFGFGGTNCHVIIEEAPVRKEKKNPGDSPSLFTLSAYSQESLDRQCADFGQFLKENNDLTLNEICLNTNEGRDQLPYRLAIVPASLKELQSLLAGGKTEARINSYFTGITEKKRKNKIVFLFPSTIDRTSGWFTRLYNSNEEIAALTKECTQIVSKYIKTPFLDGFLTGDIKMEKGLQQELGTFIILHTLARFWVEKGIKPTLLIGEGPGEYAAAAIAGIFTLEEALQLVLFKNKLLIDNNLAASKRFSEPALEAVSQEYAKVLDYMDCKKIVIPIVNSRTGKIVKRGTFNNQYWLDGLTEPSQIAEAFGPVLDINNQVFMELAPECILTARIKTEAEKANKPFSLVTSLEKGEQPAAALQKTLARLFTSGWELIFSNSANLRHHNLPLYPFEKEKCWIPQTASARTGTSGTNQRFNLTNIPFIKDHIIQDKYLLPGVAYWDIILQEALAFYKRPVYTLQEVNYLAPFMLEGNETREVKADFQGEAHNFSITSRLPGAKWDHHTTGKLSFEPKPIDSPFSIDTLKSGAKTIMENRADIYELFHRKGVIYGPRFQSIRKLYGSDNAVLAELELDEQKTQEDLRGFINHPGLLDGALQAIIGLTAVDGEGEENSYTYVPFFIEEISFVQPLPRAVYSYLEIVSDKKKNPEVIRCNVYYMDRTGAIKVQVKGMSFKRMREQETGALTGTAKQGWFYKEKYSELACPAQKGDYNTILFLRDDSAEHDKILEKISTGGNRIISVYPGTESKKTGTDTYQVALEDKSGFAWLMKELGDVKQIDQVIHLWTLTAERKSDPELRDLQAAQKTGVHSLLYLVQTIGIKIRRSLSLYIVSTGVSPLTVNDHKGAFIQGTLPGFSKVISMEYTSINSTVIDTFVDTADSQGNLSLLTEELQAKNSENMVVIKEGKRFVPRLARIDGGRAKDIKQKIKKGGTYLVTGGLGGIGREISRQLSSTHKAHIVITGRTALPEKSGWDQALSSGDSTDKVKTSIGYLKEIEKAGGSVYYFSGDIGKTEDVQKLQSFLASQDLKLDGVFHTAGILRDAIISQKTVEDIENVFQAKVYGTFLLEKVLRDHNPDFFILFSSMVSVLGNPGQCDYVSANHFMDIFAYRYEGFQVLNWTLWSEAGMGSNDNLLETSRKRGIKTFGVKEGVKALWTVMTIDEKQIIVMNNDIKDLFKAFGLPVEIENDMLPAARTEKTDKPAKTAVKETKQIQTQARAAANQTGADYADEDFNLHGLVESLIVKKAAELMSVNPGDIDSEENFLDLGLDSVNIVNIATWIGEKFKVTLYPTLLFEYPTIFKLAEYLSTEFADIFTEFFGQTAPSGQPAQAAPDQTADDAADEDFNLHGLVESLIVKKAAELMSVNPGDIDSEENFLDLGLDSVNIVNIATWIGEKFKVTLYPTLLFEYPTIFKLAEYLSTEFTDIFTEFFQQTAPVRTGSGPQKAKPETTLPEKKQTAPTAPTRVREKIPVTEAETGVKTEVQKEDIAIIAYSGRFPGSKSNDDYWETLRSGKDPISKFPAERFEHNPGLLDDHDFSNLYGGFLKDIELFDPLLFKISPLECVYLDPQQRLILEVVWEIFESAGYNKKKLGKVKTGVFIGAAQVEYKDLWDTRDLSPYIGLGNSLSIIANRISYLFNLMGPSLVVDTACSSSLVSIHTACKSLQRGESELAVAGGVQLYFSPNTFKVFQLSGMLAGDGHCKTFDRSADGYVRGEGVGAVLLKPLSKAIKDNDTIHGIIKGSAVNHDGSDKVGISAPNVNSQKEVILEALEDAGVPIDTISYIEAHGTGTSLGDPVEIDALMKVYKDKTDKKSFCALGSAKSTIGHLEAAAGISGIIKVLLTLKNKQIPPTQHVHYPNPHIPFVLSPFFINEKLRDWDFGGPVRRAGISGFGFGGTNCHMILEEYNAPGDTANKDTKKSGNNREQKENIFILSGKTKQVLENRIDQFISYIDKNQSVSLTNLCYSLNTGKEIFENRLALTASSVEQLRDKLDMTRIKGLKESANPFNLFYNESPVQKKKIAFYLDDLSGLAGLTALEIEETAGLLGFKNFLDFFKEGLTPENTTLFKVLFLSGLFTAWVEMDILPEAVYCSGLGEQVARILCGKKEAGALMDTLPVDNTLLGTILKPLGAIKAHTRIISTGTFNPVQKALEEKKLHMCLSFNPDIASIPGAVIPEAAGENQQPGSLLTVEPGTKMLSSFLKSIAKLFTAGVDISFEGLYKEHSFSRLLLPTYPFARQTYWVKASTGRKKSAPAQRTEEQPAPVAAEKKQPVKPEKTVRRSVKKKRGGKKNAIKKFITNLLVDTLKIDKIHIKDQVSFNDFGLDSLVIEKLVVDLEGFMNQTLDPAIFIQFPTIELISEELVKNYDASKIDDSDEEQTESGTVEETEEKTEKTAEEIKTKRMEILTGISSGKISKAAGMEELKRLESE